MSVGAHLFRPTIGSTGKKFLQRSGAGSFNAREFASAFWFDSVKKKGMSRPLLHVRKCTVVHVCIRLSGARTALISADEIRDVSCQSLEGKWCERRRRQPPSWAPWRQCRVASSFGPSAHHLHYMHHQFLIDHLLFHLSRRRCRHHPQPPSVSLRHLPFPSAASMLV